MPQDQNGTLDPAPAQFLGLVQAGYRQIVGPQLLQLSGYLHRSVAVGVRLHHAQILHIRPDAPAGLPVVVGQGVHIDLRPGPPQICFFHGLMPPLSLFTFVYAAGGVSVCPLWFAIVS